MQFCKAQPTTVSEVDWDIHANCALSIAATGILTLEVHQPAAQWYWHSGPAAGRRGPARLWVAGCVLMRSLGTKCHVQRCLWNRCSPRHICAGADLWQHEWRAQLLCLFKGGYFMVNIPVTSCLFKRENHSACGVAWVLSICSTNSCCLDMCSQVALLGFAALVLPSFLAACL